jgi:carbamate kinase
MKRVVIALGGNALGNSPSEQLSLVKETAISIVDLVEAGVEVIVGHGNGPQVGMVNLAFDAATKASNGKSPEMPLPECGAMTQGYIGYHLQQAIKNEFLKRKLNNQVTSIVTQVEVDAKDPSFKDPTKPIGSFYSEEEAKALAKEKN